MKTKKILAALLTFTLMFTLALSMLAVPASAKTTPAGQTVGDVLFYIRNAAGEEILVSMVPVSDMEADMKAGKINNTVYNYSVLDNFTTPVHQEAQGFTIPEFIDYAKSKSSVAALKALPMSLSGGSKIEFWTIDKTEYNPLDSYTYADLYSVERWNFPALYEQWDYNAQQYKNVDAIWASRQQAPVLLSVRAFSQRYMITDEKFGTDYNMENYWSSKGLLDNERTLRVMLPMTRDDLYNKKPTASDSRYWVANVRLIMSPAPSVASLGRVAAPTAVMTDLGDNYYIRLSCATSGATILYNHNYISPSYTPTSPYGDTAVIVPKSFFPGGEVTLTARAVKEGYTDAGVVTLKLRSAGTETNPNEGGGATPPNPGAVYVDVAADAWYKPAVDYVMGRGLFDLTGSNTFGPEAPTTRAMLAEALYRLEGKPAVTGSSPFPDSAAKSAIWANQAGIVQGMDGLFNGGGNITREMIATMMFRYAKYKGADVSAKGDLSVFPDAGLTADWARSELIWANGAKIINGMDGTINPKGTTTRAQMAQILMNYCK